MSKKLKSNFHEAYTNDELYEYLVGIDKYLYVDKDNAAYGTNDMSTMIMGIKSYVEKNPNKGVDEFINNSLLNLLETNDIYKVKTVLEFLIYYTSLSKKMKLKFSVNKEFIIHKLKEKLFELKELMLQTKNPYNTQESFWEMIDYDCFLYEIDTGKKIL